MKRWQQVRRTPDSAHLLLPPPPEDSDRLPPHHRLALPSAEGLDDGRREAAGLEVTTTQIYTHVLNRGLAAVRSPADRIFSP